MHPWVIVEFALTALVRRACFKRDEKIPLHPVLQETVLEVKLSTLGLLVVCLLLVACCWSCRALRGRKAAWLVPSLPKHETVRPVVSLLLVMMQWMVLFRVMLTVMVKCDGTR